MSCYFHKIYRRHVPLLFLAGLCLLGFGASANAQPKRKKVATKKAQLFSVPCATALRVGPDEVIKRHETEMRRRVAMTDSGTEDAADKSALRDYLACRRAFNAARLKKLPADEQADINETAAKALRLVKMRFGLLTAISFDPKSEDPINYGLTHRALTLVEDYKGSLIAVSEEPRVINPGGSRIDAARDEKRIRTLLPRIEKAALENDAAADYAVFKKEVERLLADITDVEGLAKSATAGFILQVLEIALLDEPPQEN